MTISNAYVKFEMSVNEHVVMSSDQRSSLCHPTNLLLLLITQIFQEHQLNSRIFPVFPGVVDTLDKINHIPSGKLRILSWISAIRAASSTSSSVAVDRPYRTLYLAQTTHTEWPTPFYQLIYTNCVFCLSGKLLRSLEQGSDTWAIPKNPSGFLG